MSDTIRIYLCRHGSSEANLRREYLSSRDLPLAQEGREELQNQRAAARAKLPITAVISSPMKRCLESAHILFPEFTPIQIDGLRERDFGPYEGKTWEDLKDDPEYRRWIDTEGEESPAGMESHEAFAARIRESLNEIMQWAKFVLRQSSAEKREKTSLVIFLHGGSIMEILRQIKCIDNHRSAHSRYQFQLKPGEIIALDLELSDEHFMLKELCYD